MKRVIILVWKISLVGAVCVGAFGPALSSGHDYPLHELICSNAFFTSFGVNVFTNAISVPPLLSASTSDCSGTHLPSWWLEQGSKFEDEAYYFPHVEQRTADHFYTVTAKRNPGSAPPLSDPPLLGAHTVNSYIWATSNGVVGPFYVGTNTYKWSDSRNFEFMALTNASPTVRNTNFALMFYTLGHILHLNQDLSSPDHTRNDNHKSKAYFEDYGLAHYQTNLQWFAPQPHSWPYWQAYGFSKLLDFWDRGIYTNVKGSVLTFDT